MFENNLYTLLRSDMEEGKSAFTAVIRLHGDHPLFRGHFPGNPILPGVCTVQIITELMQMAVQKPLRIEHSGIIKYLGFIIPASMPEVVFNMQHSAWNNGSLTCTALVTANDASVCSFKGSFTAFPESAFHSGQVADPPSTPNL